MKRPPRSLRSLPGIAAAFALAVAVTPVALATTAPPPLPATIVALAPSLQPQGGGVLNDMMCHSALVVRHLLTRPGEPLSSVKPVRVTGRIASLKWSRPAYVKKLKQNMGAQVDYSKAPSEDFASLTIEFETAEG